MSLRRVLYGFAATGIVLCAVIFGSYLHVQQAGKQASNWAPAPITTICPGAPQRSPDIPANETLGIPAITPQNNCTPSFTAQDVRNYITAHPVLIQAPHSAKPVIEHIWFMTVREADQLLKGGDIGLDDHAIVCYVELSGTFLPFSVPYGVKMHPISTGIVVFDAHDGNILVTGP